MLGVILAGLTIGFVLLLSLLALIGFIRWGGKDAVVVLICLGWLPIAALGHALGAW